LDIVKAVTLGVVQGLTEWLPISSTAHLKIVPSLLHWPDPGAPATAVIQLGTVAAVLAYFGRDIAQTLKGMAKAFRPGGDRNSPEARLGVAVAVGTIPICVAALLLKKYIEGPLRSNAVIGATLIVMGLVLFAAEKFTQKTRPLESVTVRDGVWVGLAQTLALVPGASRSGSTLTGAFLTGLSREAALRFSFLLSIPATTLAGLYEFKEFLKPEPPVPGAPPQMVWTTGDLALATVVALVVGYVSIAWLMKYLSRHSTLVFVVYRVIVGALLLYLSLKNPAVWGK
jgi:undecaprenyl-diphosphatase